MAQMLWATPPNMFGCMHDRSDMDNQSRGPNVFVQIIWALFLVRNSWPPPILNPKQREMGSPLMTALYWSPLHLWAPILRKICEKFCKQEFTSSHELKLHRAGCFWACDVSGCEIKGATRKKDIDRHARKHAAEKEKHNRFSQLCDREATRGGKSDFWKSISKAAAQGALSRLLHSKCCFCFRWIALALVVILRCVWPLWDFSFRSYEHLKNNIFSVAFCYWQPFDLRQDWGEIITKLQIALLPSQVSGFELFKAVLQ